MSTIGKNTAIVYLTEHNNDSLEIEITPEMIEAGIVALCLCVGELFLRADLTLEWIVTEAFEARDNARATSKQIGEH